MFKPYKSNNLWTTSLNQYSPDTGMGSVYILYTLLIRKENVCVKDANKKHISATIVCMPVFKPVVALPYLLQTTMYVMQRTLASGL